ncbi:putative glutamine amidotransferase [Pseudoxanthomonas japonensis]|jgi:putative glutamine amidotransferase|uniref:gamma-glutamyl-gamma-aminobutyrate hydrolase family protein n=1 Tax=Pseudoxanthomonas TaxID=83618 RepID=UPI0007860A65|nr:MULTISPECIES: gamma-glutamyl-gamma-aminobutyrate hydrolase family protein [Pseudoxanthomonas]MBA3930200.1 gamma-glutamyl-gamma-aminobutyrate hydrolase family protein [Xanthomonas sp.]MBL8257115.1 gamma-glutamyl-gamma-aminobutyrate hydrolase family protein [Pseudoxanthomonas mexicana]MDR7069064.1 putative glutamine amidotransferase [Pseudoxanthomonas japonensis]
MTPLPRVGLPTDHKQIGAHPFLAVGEKYVRAVVDGAGCLPLLVPTLDPVLPLRQVLDGLDGLLLTGAVSNIEPHHYSDESSYEGNLLDPRRDATNLPLIPLAIELGVPVLAICRGFQEVNVAFGGSLYQKVHEQPGFMDHRENKDDPLDVQYGPAHEVALVPGGLLATLVGDTRATVNSLHGQGVRRLGEGLVVEAQAPDGLIEAFRRDGPVFMLAVQWHPEWKVAENPFYLSIFRAFGDACRVRAARRSVAA